MHCKILVWIEREIERIISVGLLESKPCPRVGMSVDAVVLLRIEKVACGTISLELACVEIKTKTTPSTIAEQEQKLIKEEVLPFKVIGVDENMSSAAIFQTVIILMCIVSTPLG